MNVLPFLAHTFPYLHDLSTNLIYHRHVTIIHLVTSGTPRHTETQNGQLRRGQWKPYEEHHEERKGHREDILAVVYVHFSRFLKAT